MALSARKPCLGWGVSGARNVSSGSRPVCTPLPHTEVVKLIYDLEKIDYEDLLKAFWESTTPDAVSDWRRYTDWCNRDGVYRFADCEET
jgi:peptide methionine sulfoxide reductase MsrA